MTAATKVRGLLIDTSVTRMVVAHQDRLSRFEPHYLELLFVAQPRRGRSKS
jgi:predicted site-specific integrase-resolvase